MSEAARSHAPRPARGGRRGEAWARELAATLALAGPMILSNLAGTALTTIDLILIGRLGPEALGAAALATNLFHATLITSIGLVSAVAPLIAAEYGSRRHSVRDIRRSVRQGFWVALAITVPGSALLWHGEQILLALGQEARLAVEAGIYLRGLLWTLLPSLLFVVLRTFMASLGRPGWGLAIALASLPVNGLLAWALIFGRLGAPALGLGGAGMATMMTAWLGLFALSAVVMRDRRFRRYSVFGRIWRPDWPRFRRIWRVGIPVAATLAFEVAFFGAAGLVMGAIGVTQLGAHTIALQIASLCFMVPLGLAQAATIRVGHAYGAQDPIAVGMAGWAAFALAMSFALVTATMLVGMPQVLIGVFLDLADPVNGPVLTFAGAFLAFAALFQLADAAQVVGAGMLRGLQDTRVPMVYAGLGYWAIGLPLGLALAFPGGLAGNGIWTGIATGLAVVALAMLYRWVRRDRLGLTSSFG